MSGNRHIVTRDAVSDQITVPAVPTAGTDAASKSYVDLGTTTTSTGNAAIPPTSDLHELTTAMGGPAADACTLADGTQGHHITIVLVAEGNVGDTSVLTPASSPGYTTITFNGVGDTIELVFGTNGWYVIGGTAVVA